MSKKEKFVELDFVRAIAVLGVLTIHITSTFIEYPSRISLAGMNPAFLLNQLARYAVPLFFVVSGFSLGFSRTGGWAFLRRRYAKALPPYLLWSLFYWWRYHRGIADWGLLGRSLLWGTAATHLYFMCILLQLYLVYPLLRRSVERWPVRTLAASLTASLIAHQMIAGGILSQLPLWELFPTWLYYFVLGIFLCALPRERLQFLCAWTGKALPFLLALWAVYGLWYCRDAFLTGAIDSVKPQLFFYTPLVLLGGLGIGRRLGRSSLLSRGVAFLVRHSQTVYFSQVVFLELLRGIPLLVNGMRGMVLLFAAEITVTLLFSWCFDACLERIGGTLKRSCQGKIQKRRENGAFAYGGNEAAQSTTVLIQETVDAVANGSALSQETEQSLHRVVDDAQAVLAAVTQISASAAEQAESVQHMTESIDAISGVVQTSAASAQEFAGTSQEMSGQANLLKQLVDRFQLGQKN